MKFDVDAGWYMYEYEPGVWFPGKERENTGHISPQSIKEAQAILWREADILSATYPKTGTQTMSSLRIYAN